jgi:hypothetical protein
VKAALTRVAAAFTREVCAYLWVLKDAFDAAIAPLLAGFCIEQPELCIIATAAAAALVNKAVDDFKLQYCT